MGCDGNGFDFLVIGCDGNADPEGTDEVNVVTIGTGCFSKSGVERTILVSESAGGMDGTER